MGTSRAKSPKWTCPASLVAIERDEGRTPGPADALFTNTQRRLLGYLFGQPGRAFHLRELLTLTGTGHGAVQRELRRLQAAGLITATRRRARVYLQADVRSPIHGEVSALVRHTVGLGDPLREAFALVRAHVRLAFAFEPERDPGVAKPQHDLGMLLLAGERPPPDQALAFAREQAEQRLGCGLWLMSVDGTRLRDDPYIAQVLDRPRVWVFGDEQSLQRALGRDAARGRTG